MNDRPHAAELLRAAREAVSSEILPSLPESLRYTGLMVANAIAIAERELASGDAAAHAECERLRSLLADRAQPVAGSALAEKLARYNQCLAAEIRAGRYDGAERAALLEHLRQTTREKLAISNPRALQGR